MTNLTLTFIIMVSAAMMGITYSTCDYERCTNNYDRGADLKKMCEQARDALSCIDNTTKNNPDCSSVKQEIDADVAQANQLIESFCNGAAECDVKICMNKRSSSQDLKEQCRSLRDLIACLESKMNNNQACSSIRKYIDPTIDQLKKGVKDNCGGGAAGLLSSLAFCLGLSIMAYFLTSLK